MGAVIGPLVPTLLNFITGILAGAIVYAIVALVRRFRPPREAAAKTG